MKLISLKKLQSIPIAYINLVGALSVLYIWFSDNIGSVMFGVFENTSFTLFWFLGSIVGLIVGYRSSIKRMEIGSTFFALIGMGVISIILSTHATLIPTILFGFYSSWLITTTTQWIRKNEKFSFGKWIILILMSLVIALGITFGFESNSLALRTGGICALILAVSTFFIIPGQIARYIVVVASKVIFRLKITSHNNIPRQGGALLVSNHVSFLDFVILSGSIQRNIRFVMHQGIFDNKFLKPVLKKLNMIPISPRGGKNNLDEFNKRCQKEINEGHVVLIFAEGTVARNGHLLPFKKGVEYIAKGINSPIIPINLEGVLGTPLTFTQENSSAIMPNIKNICKKIFITVGKPLVSETSVFVIRQKIIELGAKSFNKRVSRKATVGKWILDISNKKQLIQDAEGNWMNGRSIKQKSLLLASRLINVLKDDSKVGLLHRNDINFNLFVYALSLLGKEIIILDPEKGKKENQVILKKLKVNICINGLEKDLNPCRKYISAKTVMSKPKFREVVSAKLRLLLPSFLILRLYNNAQGKYSNVVTFARIKNKQVHGTSLSNSMILAESLALQQIHLTTDYGIVMSLHSSYLALGFFLDALMPVTLQIQSTKGDFTVANTIIGLVTEVEKVVSKIKNKTNIKRILMNSQPINEGLKMTLKTLEVECYQGFGVNNVSPIIAVNTPDFVGKDIVGIPLVQESNNPETVGRPIPSIAVRIVKDTAELGINEWGKIWIKGAAVSKQFIIEPCGNIINDCLDWVDTNVIGMIDEKGYLRVIS